MADRRVGHSEVEALKSMTAVFATSSGTFGGGHARTALTAYLADDVTPWLLARAGDHVHRAQGAVRDALRINAHYLDVHVHRQHCDVRDLREQQRLEQEHDLFHGGPELSAQPRGRRAIFGRLHILLEEIRTSLGVAASQKLSQNRDSRTKPSGCPWTANPVVRYALT
ncbi:hypothetical protein ACFRI7_17560 [Streptomyces sp. NPDC056716]|uniref:hypothetical protein n=1 Tax=unclassified Streptomyces TaxID=2593676 RepID=UPI00367BD425